MFQIDRRGTRMARSLDAEQTVYEQRMLEHEDDSKLD